MGDPEEERYARRIHKPHACAPSHPAPKRDPVHHCQVHGGGVRATRQGVPARGALERLRSSQGYSARAYRSIV